MERVKLILKKLFLHYAVIGAGSASLRGVSEIPVPKKLRAEYDGDTVMFGHTVH